MSNGPSSSLAPPFSELTNKPLVIECEYDTNRQNLSFKSAQNCSYDDLVAKIKESFNLTACPFNVQWKGHHGVQNHIKDEATLGEAIKYNHSTDESSVTMFVQISVEYDGTSHSGASPLARREEDSAEGYQVSSADGEFSSPQPDGDAATTSSEDAGNSTQNSQPSRPHILNSDSGISSTVSILNGTYERSYNHTGTESAHQDGTLSVFERLRLEEQHNPSLSQERPFLQTSRGEEWLQARAPDHLIEAIDRISFSGFSGFSLNTDSPMSDGLSDTGVPPERYERREYYTDSRSSGPARDSEYELPVNRSQSSITHEPLVPQEVTCCSECSCILDTIKYICTTCGEKTPTSRATVIAAEAAKGKGKSCESPTSPTQTVLGRSSGSSGSSSTGHAGYELCATCFEKIGANHSSTSGVKGSSSRTLPPTQQELSLARRSPQKQKGQLRHAFLEQFWDSHGWQVVEQDETLRHCSGCQCELSGNRYKCGICEKFTICRACYSTVHNIHPNHAFLEMKAKPTSPTLSRSDISDDNALEDTIDEPSLKHSGYKCSNCQLDIVGARLHCLDCTTTSVDFCSNCDSAGLSGNLDASDGGHVSSHYMLKIPEPINETQDVSQRAHGRRYSQDGTDLGSNSDTWEDCIHSQCCNSCEEVIIGVRYQCLNCSSKPTSFNLCEDCEVKSYKVHDQMHTFLKIPRLVDIPGPLESEFPIIPVLYKYPAGPVPCSPSASMSDDPTAYLSDLSHGSALCDRHVGKMTGKWYHCAYCAKDLCADCEALDTHDNTHVFLVFKAPVDKQAARPYLSDIRNPAGGQPVLHGNIYYPRQE